MEVVENHEQESREPQLLATQHAMLVALGLYAQQVGLIEKVEAVPIKQKSHQHSPQRKVLEFFVAILAGLPHLKDISNAAHPIDRDEAVAQAWGQDAWAHYSGVSRTLQALGESEMQAVCAALNEVERPEVEAEIRRALAEDGQLRWDLDLTGRPVSSTSSSYPDTAFGRMGDTIELGYQSALVSLHSPTYGRLWLSNQLHAGDTVSATQLQAMIHAAEKRTDVRPKRRIDLLQRRLEAVVSQQQALEARATESRSRQAAAQAQLATCQQQLAQWQAQVTAYETAYAASERQPTSHCKLSRARRKVATLAKRLPRLQAGLAQAERRTRRHQRLAQQGADQLALQERHLQQLAQDNRSNPNPVRIHVRVDAGFASRENIEWLIEMGYDVDAKARHPTLTTALKAAATSDTAWQRVGSNADMMTWAAWADSTHFAYPLDVALLRYTLPKGNKHAVLLHFSDEPHPPAPNMWFHTYNGRQTIEAGIKEGKNVFQMHHLKVRSPYALRLQEHFACFAANFVRFATRWLTQQQTAASPIVSASVKQMVTVASHTSALVIRDEANWLLKFSDSSCYAGHILCISVQPIQMPLPFRQIGIHFLHF